MRGWPLTNEDETGDGEAVATLQVLIRTCMAEHDWTYGDLERRSRGELSRQRWQHYGSGAPLQRLPAPESLQLIADTLGVDDTTVLLAAGATVGLRVRRSGSTFAHLLPSGLDLLSQRTQESILALIRAVVADASAQQSGHEDETSLRAMDQPPDVQPAQRGQDYAARRRSST